MRAAPSYHEHPLPTKPVTRSGLTVVQAPLVPVGVPFFDAARLTSSNTILRHVFLFEHEREAMRPLLVLIQPVKFLNIMLEMSILDVPVKEPRRLGISSGHLFSRCPGLQSRESYHYFRCSGRWSDHQLRLQCRSFRSEGSTQNPFFVVSRIQFLSSALRSSPTIRRRGAALRSRSYSLETQALRSTS